MAKPWPRAAFFKPTHTTHKFHPANQRLTIAPRHQSALQRVTAVYLCGEALAFHPAPQLVCRLHCLEQRKTCRALSADERYRCLFASLLGHETLEESHDDE